MAKCTFISYAGADKQTADELCSFLEPRWECWIAPRDIPPNADYPASIIGAINNTKAFILICSPHSARSPHVARETALAINRKIPILVFKIGPVENTPSLETILRSSQAIDAYPLHPSAYYPVLTERMDSLIVPHRAPESRSAENPMHKNTVPSPPSPVPPLKNSLEPVYGGFFRRFSAGIFDTVIIILITFGLWVCFALLAAPFFSNNKEINSPSVTLILISIFYLVFFVIYYTLMDAAPINGTPGKKILGLMVVDSDNKSLKKPKAFYRALLKVTPLLWFSVVIPFSKKRQALHDMILKTYVVKNNG